jgi:hypothetical protein
LAPWRCQRQRQVDGDGRLADAALAGGDRDDVLGALEQRLVAGRRRCAVTTSGTTVTRRAPAALSAVSMRFASSRRSACGYAWVGSSTLTSTSAPSISQPA